MTPGWYRTLVAEPCGRCGTRLAPGTLARRLQTGRVRCEVCAATLLNETPPADVPAPAPRAVQPPPTMNVHVLQPFVERARRALDTQQPIRDVKHAATGEQL